MLIAMDGSLRSDETYRETSIYEYIQNIKNF